MWRGLGSLQVFFQPFKLSLDTVHYEAPSSHRNGAVLGHGGTFCIPHYGDRGPRWVLGVLSSVPSSMPLGSWMLFTHVDSLVPERSCAGNHPALPGPIAVTSLPLGQIGDGPSDHSPSSLPRALGDRERKRKLSNTFKRKSFTPSAHLALAVLRWGDVIEATVLARITRGFPGLWDEQEHLVLKKGSLCALGV